MEMYQRATELQPDMSRAYANLARVYVQMGLGDRVRPLLEKLLAVNPNDSMAREVLKELRNPTAESPAPDGGLPAAPAPPPDTGSPGPPPPLLDGPGRTPDGE
jgi:hypothetical protein